MVLLGVFCLALSMLLHLLTHRADDSDAIVDGERRLKSRPQSTGGQQHESMAMIRRLATRPRNRSCGHDRARGGTE
jgi:hypothetical protein